jgi:hypothetical protein
MSTADQTLSDQVEIFRFGIRRSIQRLTSLKERLELYEEPGMTGTVCRPADIW